MAASVLSVRVESDVKEAFAKLCEELGMSSSTAVNMFMRQMLRERALPFAPRLQVPVRDVIVEYDSVASAVAAAAKKRPAIETVVLFGSLARGEATEKSDIDLRVRLKEGERMGLIAMSSFVDEIRTQTGRDVDVVSALDLRADMAEEIERDGIVLYECA